MGGVGYMVNHLEPRALGGRTKLAVGPPPKVASDHQSCDDEAGGEGSLRGKWQARIKRRAALVEGKGPHVLHGDGAATIRVWHKRGAHREQQRTDAQRVDQLEGVFAAAMAGIDAVPYG